MAVIQRAYTMTPNSQCYVPVPESSWAKVKNGSFRTLEQLLKYWDVNVRKAIESMETTRAQHVRASAATNAAAAFIKHVPITSVQDGGDFRSEMLKATLDD